ncbi:MAG: PAS domain-containing sensor histidine kinase [Flavipsychrobacter sp.]
MDRRYFEFALFNNAAIGIIAVDASGQMVYVNEYALNQFGYEKDEIYGKKIETLIPQRYKNRHEQHRDHFHNHNPHNRPMGIGLDLHGSRKDGSEFPVEVSLSTYETSEGRFSVAFIIDITSRKESEKALLKLNEELEQKVKERTHSLEEALAKEKDLNELKSRFVSMASHEFRTPLSTIWSSAYLFSQYTQAEDQPKRERHIQRIVSSVNLLTDILDDFLSVGKIEEGKIQVKVSELNLKELTEDFLSELTTILKKGQSIDYQHTGEELIMQDPALLKHILMNLVSNAMKFSDEDTTITVRTSLINGVLTLSVKDQGVGISEEDQEHLFERFFRGSNVINIEGTGLGLHIVAKYAELLNGTIKCNSTLGEGTEFIVEFQPNRQ